ncbi:MAG: hypothetical protein DMF54_03335 [Acidobacteria bacterium]|nr:MAG: hypothetical protein DMF54_03335 [Acidobacteriota bacterium]
MNVGSWLRLAGVAVSIALVAACASSKRDPNLGYKSLEATVVDRQYDPPGTGGASYAGSGNYYLLFEAREGDTTSHYRFQVNQLQYNRYAEGTHVQLFLENNNLRDIRKIQ